MSMQVILRIAGIALLVVGALFAVLAIHYFVTNDIRGVMDDLSGKARAKGVAGARGRRAADARGSAERRRKGKAAGAAQVTTGTVSQAAPVASAQDTAQPAPSPVGEGGTPEDLFAQMLPDEDDLATVVVDATFAADAQDVPAGTSSTTKQTPAPNGATPAGTTGFLVTRSIVLCDSNQIIAAEES